MKHNYNTNPLKDISFSQACYIYDTSPVGSELWKNAGYRMSSIQQIVMEESKHLEEKLKTLK